MEITLTFPDSILTQLQQQAVQLNMSLNELVLKFVHNGMLGKQQETPLPILQEETDSLSLEEAIAKVKATPSSASTITRGSKVGNMLYIQELIDNPPTDTLTVDEWEKHWPLVEQELKEQDHQQAVARGWM